MVYNLQSKTGQPTVSQQKLSQKHLTLNEMKRNMMPASIGIKTAVCADISGSMAGNKIAEVRRMLNIVMTPGIMVIAFNTQVYQIERSDIPQLDASGSTYMKEALTICWQEAFKHIILITDGEPTDATDEEMLVHVSQHKDIPIDTIGIGAAGGGGYNPDLLREIARITGGRFTDCGEPIQLTSVVQNLLEHRPDSLLSAPKTGAIAL